MNCSDINLPDRPSDRTRKGEISPVSTKNKCILEAQPTAKFVVSGAIISLGNQPSIMNVTSCVRLFLSCLTSPRVGEFGGDRGGTGPGEGHGHLQGDPPGHHLVRQ